MQFCTHTSVVLSQVAMAFISFTPMAARAQFFVQASINVRAAPPDPPDPGAPPADDPLAPPDPEAPVDAPLDPPAAEAAAPEAPPAGLVPAVAEAPPPPIAEVPPVAEAPPVVDGTGGLAAGLLLQAQTHAATPNTETTDPTLYINMSFLIFCPITAFAARPLLGVLL
jgi:hypothetical protein